MGSLMDGIEVGPAKQKAAPSSSSESAKTIKLAIAIAGLLIGGVLIAWNLGVFGSAEQSTPSPLATSSDGGAAAPAAPLPPQRPTSIPATAPQPALRP